MTKAAALHRFFGSFGIPAYPSAGVPEKTAFPYLTYELVTGAWDEGDAGITVNLWYHTESEAIPNAKAQELSDRIGRSGAVVPCGGGYIRLLRGSPWCQSLRDETDNTIKRRYINITARYFTEN